MYTYIIYDQNGQPLQDSDKEFQKIFKCVFYNKVLDKLPHNLYGVVRNIYVNNARCYIVREEKKWNIKYYIESNRRS